MSVYIHIPFCKSICSYCDFCKFYYNSNWVDKYLDKLEEEIKLNYKGEVINTIYIGGGTPTCLSYEQLEKLLKITNLFNKDLKEFTVETNVDLSLDKIKLLKQYNVSRISIGMQTINIKLLKYLNRFHTKEDVVNLVNNLKQYDFNINIDLMYALKNETLEDLNNDLDFILSLDVNHISTYSLIIEPHTKLYINKEEYIDEDLDYEMYELINKKLSNYHHYEISNFSKYGCESIHNLVYWNNLNYYGFGIGASGYINNIRYENTKSFKNYLDNKFISNEHKLDIKETISNEFILGLRKIDGIDINEFKSKYNMNMTDIDIVNKLIKEDKLLLDDKLKINPKYIYISNIILEEFI